MESFEDVEYWKLTTELRREVIIVAKTFPVEEKNKKIKEVIK